MTRYLEHTLTLTTEQASQLRTHYWRKYGATLLGMMQHHGTDPHHFLYHTHQFDNLKRMSFRPGSVPQTLKTLPGTRILLTNAPRTYAVDLLRALGLYHLVDAVVTIEDMVINGRWRPKPSHWLWPALKRATKCAKPLFVDDTLDHLHEAGRHGVKPIWITKPGLGFKSKRPGGRVLQRIKHFRQVKRVI